VLTHPITMRLTSRYTSCKSSPASAWPGVAIVGVAAGAELALNKTSQETFTMKLFSLTLLLVSAAISSAAVAQSLPTGPYSSWSDSQKSAAGGALKSICGRQCSRYDPSSGQRGAYEAAACTIACFVNNLPDDYPQIDQYKNAARENYRNAKSLGSNVPVFLAK
jgi:hypothetical protein